MNKQNISKPNSLHNQINFLSSAFLTLAGGFLDSYTYSLRGGVFANAHTGNLVLIGVNILNGNNVIRYVLPVISFIVGVLVSWIIKSKSSNINSWFVTVLLAESIILFGVGFIPVEQKYANIANIIVSFVTAIQYGAFRMLEDLPFATTMCTGMLRSATDHLFKFIRQKEKNELVKCTYYYLVVAIFIVGALLGSLFSKFFQEKAVWVCVVIYITASVSYMANSFVIKKKEESKKTNIERSVL